MSLQIRFLKRIGELLDLDEKDDDDEKDDEPRVSPIDISLDQDLDPSPLAQRPSPQMGHKAKKLRGSIHRINSASIA